MATSVTFNSSTYVVPAIADASWGTNVSNYLIAISTGCLQKSGGSFTLTAEVSFGATYGLKAPYYKSASANIAAAGVVLLANADTINFRNYANSGDDVLSVDSSDNLNWNSAILLTASNSQVLTNKQLSDSTVTFINVSDATKVLQVSLGSATTGTKTTLAFSQSTNRTLTLPDATDTLVGRGTTDTFSGTKTFANGALVLAGSSSGGMTVEAPAAASTYVATLFAATDTIVGRTTADTFSGIKTFNDGKLVLAGSSSGSMTIKAPAAASTYVATLFAATDTVAAVALQQTFTNKIFSDSTCVFGNVSDVTKTLLFSLGGATTGKAMTIASSHTNARTWTIQDTSDTFVGLSTTDTMSNKTFVAPVLGAATATSINKVAFTAPATSATLTIANGKTFTASNSLTLAGTDSTTMTFPSSSDTVVTLAATQTLTNKTLTTPAVTGLTGSLNGATGTLADVTGLGIRDTSAAYDVTVTMTSSTTLGAAKTLTIDNQNASNTIKIIPLSLFSTLSDGTSGQVLSTLGTNTGYAWASALTSSLGQYNTFVGNSAGAATGVNTNLLGSVSASVSSQSYTVTHASPGVMTVTAAPPTGTTCYVTVSQNGYTANVTYWIYNVSSTTMQLCTTYANAVAGVGINTTAATAGTIVSGGLIASAPSTPTVQKFTSSSGTYTTAIGAKWIRVRMVGGGGGGSGGGDGAANGSAGSDGTSSTFGTSLLSAGLGKGGPWGGAGAAGGTSSLGSGPIGTALTGGMGQQGGGYGVFQSFGGGGGSSAFGGAGSCNTSSGTGAAGAANTGGGGAGGMAPSAAAGGNAGTGGGAGGFVDAIIGAPSATYAYVVGAGGAAGAGGAGSTVGEAGGAGGSGYIEVTEFYI
jgi:hypothetical protein